MDNRYRIRKSTHQKADGDANPFMPQLHVFMGHRMQYERMKGCFEKEVAGCRV
jgi:hypothetical protein